MVCPNIGLEFSVVSQNGFSSSNYYLLYFDRIFGSIPMGELNLFVEFHCIISNSIMREKETGSPINNNYDHVGK